VDVGPAKTSHLDELEWDNSVNDLGCNSTRKGNMWDFFQLHFRSNIGCREAGAMMVLLAAMTFGATVDNAFASPSVHECNYGQLEVAVAWGPGAAAGHIGIPFLIANTSKSTCTLEGFPTLHVYPAAGNKSVKVIHSGGMIYGAVKPKLVVIKPGADASFGLNYVDALNQQDSNGPSCTAQSIYVTLPLQHDVENYETTVNFNFCYSGFEVGVTAIQFGPVPKEG